MEQPSFGATFNFRAFFQPRNNRLEPSTGVAQEEKDWDDTYTNTLTVEKRASSRGNDNEKA